MTTQEKVKIMQAYLDGKQIQYSDSGNVWSDTNDPAWDWFMLDYRIKPEEKKPVYRAYKDTNEMVEDFNVRFGVDNPPHTRPLIWIKGKSARLERLITVFYQTNVASSVETFSMDKLFNQYTYLDGTPVGKLVE